MYVFPGTAAATATALSPMTVAKEPDPEYHNGRMSKPARERKVGMAVTADDGIERLVRRHIDRRGNWYEETVWNPDGSIRHHDAGPLDDHRDHGSAKPKPST